MTYTYEILFDNGETLNLDTDVDLVAAHIEYKLGKSISAPENSEDPLPSGYDSAHMGSACAFVVGYFSIDLSEVVYVKNLKES